MSRRHEHESFFSPVTGAILFVTVLSINVNVFSRLFFLAEKVSQMCNEDGMEFTLRTPEGFSGRIYTYGYYDRCFFRGTGGTTNVLRITGARGFPDCGTARVSPCSFSRKKKSFQLQKRQCRTKKSRLLTCETSLFPVE